MSPTPPTCFGKNWISSHPECNGGHDPSYVHPIRKDNVRDRCSWYSQCASRTCASRLNPQEPPQVQVQVKPAQVAPPPTVMRPQVPAYPQPQPYPYPQPQPYPQYQSVQMTHPSMGGFTGMAPPGMAFMQPAAPVNYPMPGMQMPAYLTVPEPLIPGQGLVRPFMATMGRSVLKALGHAAANWFDHVPWNAWPTTPPPYWTGNNT